MTTSQQVNFTISPKHLIEIIQGQTDGLDKAFGEIVMNSVDAGASAIHITMEKAENNIIRFSIKDDGKGMSKKDILNYFKIFGNPHERGDATFGRFRMGRSQLMYYASTVWFTRKYAMSIDIYEPLRNKTLKNLGFNLKNSGYKVDGCHIHGYLYPDNLEHGFTIDEFRKSLTSLIRYINTPVYFNNELISTKVKDIDRNDFSVIYEDAFAYYFLDPSYEEIFLYNQGVLVQFNDLYKHLAKGVIISKSSLALDHSRRTILTERCPIYKGIVDTLKQVLDKEFLSNFDEKSVDPTNFSLKACEYIYNQNDFTYNKAFDLIMNQPMFYDMRSKTYSLVNLLNLKRIAFAEDETPISTVEAIERIEDVLVLSPYQGFFYSIIYHIRKFNGYDIAVNLLNKICQTWVEANNHSGKIEYCDLEIIEIDFKSDVYKPKQEALNTLDLTDQQKQILADLNLLNNLLFEQCPSINTVSNKREIVLGHSDAALAWTDGSTTIWFNFEYALSRLEEKNHFNLLMTLIHEYCHIANSTLGHDDTFYQQFHDFVGEADLYKVLNKINGINVQV